MTWEPKNGISLEMWYVSSLSLEWEFIWLVYFLLKAKTWRMKSSQLCEPVSIIQETKFLGSKMTVLKLKIILYCKRLSPVGSILAVFIQKWGFKGLMVFFNWNFNLMTWRVFYNPDKGSSHIREKNLYYTDGEVMQFKMTKSKLLNLLWSRNSNPGLSHIRWASSLDFWLFLGIFLFSSFPHPFSLEKLE